jgi:pyridinium-3,5-bisthiocarboxylic acid mononucleotide nickel chelatase
MKIAVVDPASGIAGDMFLGALVDVGLDSKWLERLPATLGLEGIGVRIAEVKRCGVRCIKVDFDIPPQPHGRPVSEIHTLIDRAGTPATVAQKAHATFDAIAQTEATIHGVSTEKLHLHEVGSVDAILDIIGSIWGLELLGVQALFNTRISVGDGTVKTAHGVLPVPAPATLRLLEGLSVAHGPNGSGELTTPTGAALLKVLSKGPPPAEYKPARSGYGAGTRDIKGQLNAVRIILGESISSKDNLPAPQHQPQTEHLHVLSADIDDMSPEELAGAAETLRAQGALDVVLLDATMKKGRPGTRVEALVRASDAARLEEKILIQFTTLGVKRSDVLRTALQRESKVVNLGGHEIRVKVSRLPDGTLRAKAEFDDLNRVAQETMRPLAELRAEITGLLASEHTGETVNHG